MINITTPKTFITTFFFFPPIQNLAGVTTLSISCISYPVAHAQQTKKTRKKERHRGNLVNEPVPRRIQSTAGKQCLIGFEKWGKISGGCVDYPTLTDISYKFVVELFIELIAVKWTLFNVGSYGDYCRFSLA